MQTLVIHMQSYVFAEAIERTLKAEGDFHVILVNDVNEIARQCELVRADILFMEVSSVHPYNIDDRMEISDGVRQRLPECKVALLVNENTDCLLTEEIKQLKRDGRIDLFLYSSVSASYMTALIDTL